MNSTIKSNLTFYSVNPETGDRIGLLSDIRRGFDFGNIRSGAFCPVPIVLEAVFTSPDASASADFNWYLQNDGGFSHSEFFAQATTWGSGQPWLKLDHTVANDASYGWTQLLLNSDPLANPSAPGNHAVSVSSTGSTYIWLSLLVGTNDVGVTRSINFRAS